MKLHRLCLVGAAMLVVLPRPPAQEQPPAQTEILEQVRELHARFDALEARHAREREEYERTISELKREVDELRGKLPEAKPQSQEDELESLLQELSAEGLPGEEPLGFVESVGRAVQTFNPDISVNADFVGHYSNREGGELDDEFLFRHFEIGFSGNIDPYTRADIFVGIGRHEGEWHTHLEEAYLTYLGLP